MTRHRGATIRGRVFPNRMVATFTHKLAAMPPQVVEKVSSFHGTASCGTKVTRGVD